MATILPFVVSPRAAASIQTGEAAIIIFPGVRYEPAEGGDGRRGQAGSGVERKGR